MPAEAEPLAVLNLSAARFECTYGRGCDGVCCRDGRPPLYPEDILAIERCRDRLEPLMRPAARARVAREGYVTRALRHGRPALRVAAGWCVFFNGGCLLHKAGAAEGDPFRYKPALCALFPLQADERDRWYVRQKGFKRERWELACLDPATSARPAAESLAGELALARRYTGAAARPARLSARARGGRRRRAGHQGR